MQYHAATITTKMQLTLPKRLCERLGIKRGDKLAVTVEHGAIILTPGRTQIEGAAGSLDPGRAIDMNISPENNNQ
jgi:AbrB family looped-hinge helix DNA binding protein